MSDTNTPTTVDDEVADATESADDVHTDDDEDMEESAEKLRKVRQQTAQKMATIYKDSTKIQHLKSFELKHDVRTMCVVDEEYIWVASRDGSIHIRDIQIGNRVGVWKAHRPDSRVTTKLFANAIYADRMNDKVWVGASDGIIRVLSKSRSPKMLSELTDQHTGGIKCVVGNDDHVWTASENFTILQRAINNGAPVNKLVGHSSWVRAMVYDDELAQLWSASTDGIRVWSARVIEAQSGSPPILQRTPSSVSSSKRRRPATARMSRKASSHSRTDSDHSILTLDGFVDSNCVAKLEGHDGTVLSLLVVGSQIWSGGTDGYICIWDTFDRTLVKKFHAHTHWILCLRAVGDNVWSACKSDISVWDSQGNHLQALSVGKGKVADIAYSAGRVWVGCRSPASLQIYRVFSARNNRASIRSRLVARRRGTWDPVDTHGGSARSLGQQMPTRRQPAGDRGSRLEFLKGLKRRSVATTPPQMGSPRVTTAAATTSTPRSDGRPPRRSRLKAPGFILSNSTPNSPVPRSATAAAAADSSSNDGGSGRRSRIPMAQHAHDEVGGKDWEFDEDDTAVEISVTTSNSSPCPPYMGDDDRMMTVNPTDLSREELILFVKALRERFLLAQKQTNEEQLAKLVLAATLDKSEQEVCALEKELEVSRQLEFEATEKLARISTDK